MLFTQIEFILFFILLLTVLFSVQKIFKQRNINKLILLVASYYFYSCWDYRFLLLLFFSTLFDYFTGKFTESSNNTAAKKCFLALCITVNLCILGVFKYCNFFIAAFNDVVFSGKATVGSLEIILPLGISFYTFRLISYGVDVYRGRIVSSKSILDFALYVAFFPIIVSGPIVRASSFLPQLKTFSITTSNLYAGFRLVVVGLFLKIFIADRLAIFVNHYYANYQLFDMITTWLAVSAYSLQIYCDFAGYSNIAIGLALMLGFSVEENFNFPYLATNIIDFWKRWHMTLSSWIRDYLYIPLGGSRKGKQRTYINLLIAMTLCGLWHGAAWTFVLWGFFHGLLLVINHAGRRKFDNSRLVSSYLHLSIARLLTFFGISLGWVLFRSDNWLQSISIIHKMFSFEGGIAWYQPFVIFVILSSIIIHLLKIFDFDFLTIPLYSKYMPAMLFCLIFLIIVFFPDEFQPFLYLQF